MPESESQIKDNMELLGMETVGIRDCKLTKKDKKTSGSWRRRLFVGPFAGQPQESGSGAQAPEPPKSLALLFDEN